MTNTSSIDSGALKPRLFDINYHRRQTLLSFALLLPAAAAVLILIVYPLYQVLDISFRDGKVMNFAKIGELPLGFGNYARVLGDPLFWRSTLNTALFTLIVTPLSMALGLGAAVLLNSVLPARPVFRSILILPMAVSGVATALMGVLIFDENSGVLDGLLQTIGLPRIAWQSGGAAAFASVVLVTLWWRTGFNMLIYLAGLQGVNPALYEAARLDGANGWQQFRHVTVPLVGPSTFFLLILNVIYSFQVFDIVFVLTGGGPQNSTSVLVTYAYDTGFVTRDQGYAAAIGIVLLILTMIFTAVQWRTNRSRDLVE